MQQCNITSFDAHWKTDNKVDQPKQWNEHSECYSNTFHTCESVTLRCHIVAECLILYTVLHLALGNHPHKLATSPSGWMCCRQGQLVHKGCRPPKTLRKIKPNIWIRVFVGTCTLFKSIWTNYFTFKYLWWTPSTAEITTGCALPRLCAPASAQLGWDSVR
jgi:hypothetical protein